MDRPQTPPQEVSKASGSRRVFPPTPEVTRRIEENRLRAKALRDQHEESRRKAGDGRSINRTPSGFVATADVSIAGRKRAHAAISTTNVPETQRDARNNAKEDGAGGSSDNIQAARKFLKYVDYDLSKMTDTKGGFMTTEDDPFNKVLNTPKESDKPAHMTLKEWERFQLLKSLKSRKEGPYEPGLSVLETEKAKKCRECGSVEIDWQWEEVFKCMICNPCKEKYPEKYSLLTKTEAKDDYLLTDPELRDQELLPHMNQTNPHKSHWHDMMLFLRYQVEEYAFKTKWGSAEALDAEFEKREADKKRRKEAKFKSKLQELKRKTRTEHFRRSMKDGGKGGSFGDTIGGGRHEHEWGRTVENADGVSVKTCVECGMEVEELEF